MFITDIAQSRAADLQVDATKIEFRRQWHTFNTADRLEATLRKVRRQAPISETQPVSSY